MERVLRGFQCQKCGEFFTANELAKAENSKDRLCPKDGGSVVPALFCEKVGYQCPADGNTDHKAAKCKKCGKDLQKVVNRAKVVFKCVKCGATFDAMPPDSHCPTCNHIVKQWCTKSGTFPHGSDPTNIGTPCR